MLHPQAHDLNNALEKAIRLKTDWNLDRALDLSRRISEKLGLDYEYDDGPPENWVDLDTTEPVRGAGLVSIFVPLVLMQRSFVTAELQGILAPENISFLSFDDWHKEIYHVSATTLNRIFEQDYSDYPEIENDEAITMHDFWCMTVT